MGLVYARPGNKEEYYKKEKEKKKTIVGILDWATEGESQRWENKIMRRKRWELGSAISVMV